MDQPLDNNKVSEADALPSSRIFVGGLAWAVTDDDLKSAFLPLGAVEAEVVRYQDTGRSRGFGFVGFNSVEEATKAMREVDGKEILGRSVKIGYARERKEESKTS